jgi:F0F1-type ATP synthase assembly protein I
MARPTRRRAKEAADMNIEQTKYPLKMEAYKVSAMTVTTILGELMDNLPEGSPALNEVVIAYQHFIGGMECVRKDFAAMDGRAGYVHMRDTAREYEDAKQQLLAALDREGK